VRFGDGVHGASPSKALKVEVTFGTGAGAIRIGLRRSRTTGSRTRDQALWSSIRNRTSAIVFWCPRFLFVGKVHVRPARSIFNNALNFRCSAIAALVRSP
jgi:hypothetical protein